ncbi:hypothetical protein CPB86DRAFT_779827 [Serendipita vermifera]|nr:hypothetical protein CPB86DRAFT_779827 [Serendipita vermifera]
MTLSNVSILDVFPIDILQLIIRLATLPSLALDTTPESVLLAKQPLQQRNHHFFNDIRASLRTKLAIALVCKPWRVLVEPYLLECIILQEFDRIGELHQLLASPSLLPDGKPKGSLCRRLDFALGRRGHWWSGEGRQSGFKTLWGLLPHCKNLEMLVLDPYITNPNHSFPTMVTLHHHFWDTLIRTCASTLRLLIIHNMQAHVADLQTKLVKLSQLEVLEHTGRWHNVFVEQLDVPVKVMPKLHYLQVFDAGNFYHLRLPIISNAFISTGELDTMFTVLEQSAVSLKRLTYLGPSFQLLDICERFPNLEHLCLRKQTSYSWHTTWTQNGYFATSLRTIAIHHHRVWPFARPLLENIVELKKESVLPNLKLVHYVEAEDTTFLDRVESRTEGGATVLKSSFDAIGVELLVEKRFLGSELP